MISVQEEWAGIQVHESALAAISFAVSRESHKVVFGVRIHSDQLSWIFGLVGERSIHELKALEVQHLQVHQLRGFFEIHQEVGGTSFLKMEVIGVGALIEVIEIINRSRAEVHVSELKRAVPISVSFTSSSLHAFVEGLWISVVASSSSFGTLRNLITSDIISTHVSLSSEIELASVFSVHRVNVCVPACVSDVCNLVVDINVCNLLDWLLFFLASSQPEDQILK